MLTLLPIAFRYVAYAAANAGVAMAKGSLVGSDKKEWKEIVHR